RGAPHLAFRDDDCSSSPLEEACVLRLMIAGGEQAWNEHGRLSRSRQLPDRTARAGEYEVARTQCGSELLRECEEPVIRALDTGAELVVVAGAGEVQDRRAYRAECLHDELVEDSRAQRPSEDEQHGPGLRQTEQLARL